MALISIIVPIYNTSKYLDTCLHSLTVQSLKDIEIICIDDASTDNSLLLAERHAQQDSRIKIIKNLKNQGTLQTRKRGVEVAEGTYLMFVDSDDWLEPEACQQLVKKMEQEQVDVLQYGTNVIPAVAVSADMISWVENFLNPYPKRLMGREILRACFLEDRFDFNITDKIWRTKLCKQAFEKIENLTLSASEDRYTFFVLAYYSTSYLGLLDARYYNYNIGIGVTGSDQLDIKRFEKRCTGVEATRAVERFLKSENTLNRYEEEFHRFGQQILWDCVHCWINKLSWSEQGKGYDILLKYWSAGDILGAIGRMYFEDAKEIMNYTKDSALMSKTRCCAIYYRYLGYEPMEKFIKEQAELTKHLGEQVVLISDEDAPLPMDLDWQEHVIRLPASKDANWDQYGNRAKAFEAILTDHSIDYVLYASPTSHIAWLDILLIRSMGIPVSYMNENREKDWQEHCNQLEKSLEETKQRYICLEHNLNEYKSNYEQIVMSRSYKISIKLSQLLLKIKTAFKH